MIKEILKACDYSLFAEIAMLMFFGVFVAVSLRVLFSDRQEARQCAQSALTDPPEFETHE